MNDSKTLSYSKTIDWTFTSNEIVPSQNESWINATWIPENRMNTSQNELWINTTWIPENGTNTSFGLSKDWTISLDTTTNAYSNVTESKDFFSTNGFKFTLIGAGIAAFVLTISIFCCCCCCKKKKRGRKRKSSNINENELSIQIRLPVSMSDHPGNKVERRVTQNNSSQPITVYCPIIQGQNNTISTEKKNIIQSADVRVSNDPNSDLENMLTQSSGYVEPREICKQGKKQKQIKASKNNPNFEEIGNDPSKQPIYTEIIGNRTSDSAMTSASSQEISKDYHSKPQKHSKTHRCGTDAASETEYAEINEMSRSKEKRSRRGRFSSIMSNYFYPRKLWSIDLK